MATITELINDASEIRDAELEQENTAFKVGTMLVNIIEYIGGMSDNVTEQFSMYFANGHLKEAVLPSAFVSALSTAIEACATHDSDNLLDLLYSRIIPLDSMGSELDGVNYTPSAGDLVWRNNYVFRWDGSDWGNGIPPRKHVVYINKHTRKLYMHTGSAMVEIGNGYADKIQISKMDQSSVDNIPVGKLHFVVGRNKLVYRISANEVCEWTPSTKLIYIDASTNTIYRWQGSVWVALSSGSGEFVNDLTTGGVDKGLTAEQGKVLKGKIDEVQANVVNLHKRLANMAFPTAADKAAAVPAELDWSIPKVAVTITNSIGSGIAVIKRNGQAVSGSVMVEQGESLTLTIEGADGYGLTSVSAAVDGGSATPLPGVNGVFTLNVAQVNAAMSIVITGTYSQTVGITYNLSHCTKTSGQTSVVTGGGATIEITADEGYTLQSVTPTVTGATIDSWTLNAGVGTLVISNVTGAVVVSAEANEAGAVEITTTANKATVTDNGAKQGGTLVLTVAPSSGYGFKAAEDANDVNRGVILVKDGNNNVIVDTVNGIGLDKVTYGALTKAAINSLYPKYWSRFPSFASTIITIDNAPAAVSVNVASALIFQENAFRDDYTIGNILRTYPYYRAVNVNSLPCNAAAYIEPVGTVTSTSKCLWGGRATVGQFAVDAHNPSLICCSGNTRTGFWQTTWNQDISLVGKTIDRWSVVFCAGKDANDKPYLESAYLYHYPSGNTSNASDRNVIFDGSDKSLWILVPDDVSPKVVLKGIPEGVVPKRWSSDGTASRSCVKIDGYYTEWGDPGAGITITMTGVSNVTCSDSNVSITESSGTFTIVVSNLTSGEVRNVNLNVTV